MTKYYKASIRAYGTQTQTCTGSSRDVEIYVEANSSQEARKLLLEKAQDTFDNGNMEVDYERWDTEIDEDVSFSLEDEGDDAIEELDSVEYKEEIEEEFGITLDDTDDSQFEDA